MAEVLLATPRSVNAEPATVVVRDGAGNIPGVPAPIPTGVMMMWCGEYTAPPSGWLLCDGAEISRTTYADLFAVIGTTFGSGDESTTFDIPNLNQRFPQGVTGSIGGTGGNLSHTHGLTDAVADVRMPTSGTTFHARLVSGVPSRVMTAQGTSAATFTSSSLGSTIGAGLTGDTDSASSLPLFIQVGFIIKI